MGDRESCSSRALNCGWNDDRMQKLKVEVFNEILSRLRELNEPEVMVPDFEDELWVHFYRLPTRYALDMKVERAQDVLMHKRLQHMARAVSSTPAVEVRLVQVLSFSGIQGQGSDTPGNTRPMHEITISANDKPKLFSQLTSLLSEIGLNIQEAHAFSTFDGYSLDVFVADGWPVEETEKLKHELTEKLQKLEVTEKLKHVMTKRIKKLEPLCSIAKENQPKIGINCVSNHVIMPINENSEWEIDASCLIYEKQIAFGSVSNLYKGTYYNQDVAIKVLKDGGNHNEQILREFYQEIYILSKIQHKNVIKFIGACKKPNLCLVTEFMSGGSIYDMLHVHKNVPTLPSLLKVAIGISEGMNYLHQKNIIHRDLKTANLLMDEKGVVKVGDFGVARLEDQSIIMTAETGTYRWMAPEVIQHQPYNYKVDVFSFGIILWELLTGKLPYEHLSPLQAALGVVQKGITKENSRMTNGYHWIRKDLRPEIPGDTHPKLVELLHHCWHRDPSLRPDFSEILKFLQHVSRTVAGKGKVKVKAKRMH